MEHSFLTIKVYKYNFCKWKKDQKVKKEEAKWIVYIGICYDLFLSDWFEIYFYGQWQFDRQ